MSEEIKHWIEDDGAEVIEINSEDVEITEEDGRTRILIEDEASEELADKSFETSVEKLKAEMFADMKAEEAKKFFEARSDYKVERWNKNQFGTKGGHATEYAREVKHAEFSRSVEWRKNNNPQGADRDHAGEWRLKKYIEGEIVERTWIANRTDAVKAAEKYLRTGKHNE